MAFNLGAGSVISRVGHGMAHEAISTNLEQCRQITFSRALNSSQGCFANGKNVHPVNKLGRYLVSASLLRNILQGHSALERSAHPILIVFTDIDARQFP